MTFRSIRSYPSTAQNNAAGIGVGVARTEDGELELVAVDVELTELLLADEASSVEVGVKVAVLELTSGVEAALEMTEDDATKEDTVGDDTTDEEMTIVEGTEDKLAKVLEEVWLDEEDLASQFPNPAWHPVPQYSFLLPQ
jgi:hypothetical protein